jgi:hypothetical protein
MSPYFNIELTDFSCRIPLELRDARRILLAYLKRYHPETAKFVLSNYIFPANSSWRVYRSLFNYIIVLNALGFKIPFFQWYIKKHSFPNIYKQHIIYRFQQLVCRDSDFINDTFFKKILNKFPHDKVRLMRIFNIAVLNKRLELDEDSLKDYLMSMAERARNHQY